MLKASEWPYSTFVWLLGQSCCSSSPFCLELFHSDKTLQSVKIFFIKTLPRNSSRTSPRWTSEDPRNRLAPFSIKFIKNKSRFIHVLFGRSILKRLFGMRFLSFDDDDEDDDNNDGGNETKIALYFIFKQFGILLKFNTNAVCERPTCKRSTNLWNTSKQKMF